ncbi:carbohydrate kinase family protein [Demequina zhanjiangensis]|uniref:PfkB family carbohydrate kinase n=1 Tax=Demequina zhanjiangensis TaxID=3051659 RepID=A0ABT8G0G4_9MICO|nr:PfkB family carbohydrate kinase [Demequina sp. SYSU T00b26]MDN4472625.1 PfkB family carbohydrate kinase [Demequina sp. SYSU T00b26]
MTGSTSGAAPTVAVIGPVSVDTIVTLEHLPAPVPHTVMADRWSTQIGGTSAGKALHLSDLGAETLLFTTEGDDESGAEALRVVESRGVAVHAIPTGAPVERHLNLMSRHGARVSVYLQPAGDPDPTLTAARLHDLRTALPGIDAVFLDLAPLSLSLAPAIAASGVPVWVDIHDYDGADPFHEPFLEAADVILMNGDRIGDIEGFLSASVLEGRHAAVCTLGADGAVGISGDGTPVRVPAARTTVVDPNGAGDAFAAGMLMQALREGCAGRPFTAEELERCMDAGAAQAVTAVSSEGLAPNLPIWTGAPAIDS